MLVGILKSGSLHANKLHAAPTYKTSTANILNTYENKRVIQIIDKYCSIERDI